MKNLKTETLTNKLVSIQKVLVEVDLSDHSEATVSYAAEVAKCFDASLTIVHVHEPVPVYEYASETTYALLDDQRRDLQKRLDELNQKVRKIGLVCESVYLVGEPAEQISALARDIDADLIVTASHHPTFLGRLFNLDKAPQIMHRAPCPVLICHGKNTQ
jgi:universal stress protein A